VGIAGIKRLSSSLPRRMLGEMVEGGRWKALDKPLDRDKRKSLTGLGRAAAPDRSALFCTADVVRTYCPVE